MSFRNSVGMTRFCLALIWSVALVNCAWGVEPGVEVTGAWVRGTVPGQTASGVFLEIRSNTLIRLLGASSPVADMMELHQMKVENGMMRMSLIKAIEIPPRKSVKLDARGYHIMMMGLRHQLKEGELVPIKLKIEGADTTIREIQVDAQVRPVNSEFDQSAPTR